MTHTLVRLQKKGQMVIPLSLRELAGVSEGTLIKIALIDGGRFLLTPQFTVDRSVVTGKKDRKQALQQLAQIVAEIRDEAREKGIDKMSKREINAAVSAARKSLKKTAKPAVT